MITVSNRVFTLETERTSYLFRATPLGHLEHIHYGERIPAGEIETLLTKRNIILLMVGSLLLSATDAILRAFWEDYRPISIAIKLGVGLMAGVFAPLRLRVAIRGGNDHRAQQIVEQARARFARAPAAGSRLRPCR